MPSPSNQSVNSFQGAPKAHSTFTSGTVRGQMLLIYICAFTFFKELWEVGVVVSVYGLLRSPGENP